MDTVTQWQALRALRLAGEAAFAMADATAAGSAPTPENAKALSDKFVAMVYPAFCKALDAGVSCYEAMRAFAGAEAAAAVNGVMADTVAELRREEKAARRADWAEVALRVARRQALRGLRLVAESARASANRIHVATVVTALRNAVKAGVPLKVALDVLERAGVPDTRALGAALGDSRAQAADAEARVRSAIPLPEPVRDHSESAAVDAEAHASPTPELAPEAGESTADLRAIDVAAAAIGATFTEPVRRIAAGAVNQLRTLADWTMERAERHRQSFGRGRILRRPRASRAPRRAARRSAGSSTRDGPPPPDDAPAPVANRWSRSAAGGSR